MIDLLKLRSNEEVKDRDLKKIFPDNLFSIVKIPDSLYGDVLVIKGQLGHALTLKQNPIHHIPAPTQIIVNPSNWPGLSSLSGKLERIVNLNSLLISRIDHKIDIDKPVDFIYSGLKIKHKQDVSKHFEREDFKRGRLTGFYIGKEPELYCIYDKAYQLFGKKLKRKKDLLEGQCTRIELRQFKQKVKEPHFSSLAFYIQNPPFSNLELYQPNEILESHKRYEIKSDLQELGFNHTFQKRNKQGNFNRDYLKYFTEINFKDFANKVYSEGLTKFMES